MRVIKLGHVKRNRVKCPGCNSVLEYTHKDVSLQMTFQSGYIVCPVCDRALYVQVVRLHDED